MFWYKDDDDLSEQDDIDLTADEDILREIEEMSNVRKKKSDSSAVAMWR